MCRLRSALKLRAYFNTKFVIAKFPDSAQMRLCLRYFNTKFVIAKCVNSLANRPVKVFQYKICYSKMRKWLNIIVQLITDFNTKFVIAKSMQALNFIRVIYFNTKFVIAKYVVFDGNTIHIPNFNTKFVIAK